MISISTNHAGGERQLSGEALGSGAIAERLESVRVFGRKLFAARREQEPKVCVDLFKSLRLGKGERLLIRGGTTPVGLAAAAIARNHGAVVGATKRRPDREQAALERR